MSNISNAHLSLENFQQGFLLDGPETALQDDPTISGENEYELRFLDPRHAPVPSPHITPESNDSTLEEFDVGSQSVPKLWNSV